MTQVYHALIGDKETGFSSLFEEYFDADERHLNHCYLLSKTYTGFRRIRGDGNCLYTAFLYGYLESLIIAHHQYRYPRLLDQILSHNQNHVISVLLKEAGFDLEVIDDFYQALAGLLTDIFASNNDKDSSLAILTSSLNEDSVLSNSIIAYLRLVASGWIRMNSNKIIPYILFDDYESTLPVDRKIGSYCSRIVEPMDQSSDDISILALVKAFTISSFLPITCKIISMDTNKNYLPEYIYKGSTRDDHADSIYISLLFRPGHYDLLYE